MEEKNQLGKILEEIKKIKGLEPQLKTWLPSDVNRRRTLYKHCIEIAQERYEELIAEGFEDSDSELQEPINEIKRYNELLKELDKIEKVLEQIPPMYEINNIINVNEYIKKMAQERYEDFIVEGFEKGDEEVDNELKEIAKAERIINDAKKLKAILPEDFKSEKTASGSSSKQSKGRKNGPTTGKNSGPANRPTPGATTGPNNGPANGPTTGATTGPNNGPANGPTAGATTGPNNGPANGPTTGATTGPTIKREGVLEYIEIDEADEKIYWKDFGGQEQFAPIKEAFETKKAKFNRLEIFKKCKQNIRGPLKTIRALRLYGKINPEVVMVLQFPEYSTYLQDYIQSIHQKKELTFDLIHNFEGTKRFAILKGKKFIRSEKKVNAKIFGRFSLKRALQEGRKKLLEAQSKKSRTSKKGRKEELDFWESHPLNREQQNSTDKQGTTKKMNQYRVNNSDNHIEEEAIKEIMKEEQAKTAQQAQQFIDEEQSVK